MGQRQVLQQVLETLCEHVYFQPPANVQMEYPAIVYQRSSGVSTFANNDPYHFTKRYEVTLIARSPDEVILDKIAGLPMTTYDRFFVADNLNHDVFTIYF